MVARRIATGRPPAMITHIGTGKASPSSCWLVVRVAGIYVTAAEVADLFVDCCICEGDLEEEGEEEAGEMHFGRGVGDW